MAHDNPRRGKNADPVNTSEILRRRAGGQQLLPVVQRRETVQSTHEIPVRFCIHRPIEIHPPRLVDCCYDHQQSNRAQNGSRQSKNIINPK